MDAQRKKYVVDRKFQYSLSMKIAVFPLVTFLVIGAILFIFAYRNSMLINEIVATQDSMIEMFLSTPALQATENPVIQNGEAVFKSNIGKLVSIRQSSELIVYFILLITIIHTVAVFTFFVFMSHRISGPIYVITQHLREINQGRIPKLRPLRKNDELK
ncbi:MAG TPA: hypothetical protein ENN21_06515, partial [Spirochaetes bacterium]|nr:hypothetical protein [Spirochaetota bacterium]